MDESKLRQLLRLFEESDLEELEYQHSFWRGTRIRFGRKRRAAAPAQPETSAGFSPALQPPETTSANQPDTENLYLVNAPMVGTFFRASSPEAAPFVHPGDRVEAGQTLCIIEAMKIMNEIQAEVEGEIVDILAEDSQPVEYNQPLMTIRPARR